MEQGVLGEAGFAEISFQHFSYFWREYGMGGDRGSESVNRLPGKTVSA